ncbi:MAG: VOC family protein [Fimbriimonadaceae bacterium]|nr:VOC family protein [Fimbriimonadaceae bacterium]
MATTTDQMALAVGSTFIWHEIYVPDGTRAVEFYTSVLGWTTQVIDMGPGGTYTMLVNNGTPVCGVSPTGGKPELANVPPHWSTYIAVDDVDARLAKCTELGGKVIVPPMDIPTIGRMALIQDPQGATFWLFKGMEPV